MRIENLRFEKHGNNLRAVANVIWEDCPRSAQDLYFETEEEFADSLSCDPHAFLVACIMPALHYGEERLLVEGAICPELEEGLNTAMSWMRFWWYDPSKKLVKIESKTSTNLLQPRKHDRAGFFFSGGIDSLATILANRANYPMKHPGSIKDGLLVYGLEVADPTAFHHVVSSVSILARDADITLIPVYTNMRFLGPEDDLDFWGNFWVNEFMGAAFSAIAHAFSKRLTLAFLSSDHDISNIYPFSSHPLVNPHFSSFNLRFELANTALSRFERSELVSKWDLALKHLRVCNKPEYYSADTLNCGQCEKCIRTMLALQILGVLERASAFPVHSVSAEQIERCGQLEPNTFFFWSELIDPLKMLGQHGLLEAVEQKIGHYHQAAKRKRLRKSYIEPIIKLDEKKFGGTIRKLKRVVYSKGIWTRH